MSKLITIACEMHKIAEFTINVKYRRPGNVVGYIPVEFEVFIDGQNYKAIPLQDLQTRMLVNLPAELVFQIMNGKIYNHKPGTEEIVHAIVTQLAMKDDIQGKHSAQTVTDLPSSPVFL